MSYGGSFRAVWAGFLAALVLLWPLTTYAAGSSVTITAVIRPVRIVVVNDEGTITQILSNGPGDTTPSVHLDKPDGPLLPMAGRIASQYGSIMRRADQQKTGVIYENEEAPWPFRFPNPSVISVMFTGLRSAL